MPHPHRRPSQWKRRTAITARWLHIYLSMAGFVILFFFAVTGLTLNHPDAWSGEARTARSHGTMNPGWVAKNVANSKLWNGCVPRKMSAAR